MAKVTRNIQVEDVPVGAFALARINTLEDGAAEDVDKVTVEWLDHNNSQIDKSTWSGSDVDTTGANGETVTIEAVSGTGIYEAKLEIDSGTYGGSSFPLTFTVKIDIEDEDGIHGPESFTFDVVSGGLDITLESTSPVTDTDILRAVRRQSGMRDHVVYVAEGDEDTRQNDRIDLGGEGPVFDIIDAWKNGSTFSAYSWNQFQTNVTLDSTPSANDHFTFLVQRGMSKDQLQSIIDSARKWVLSELDPLYDTDISATPTVVNLIKDISVGRVRELNSRGGNALESANYRSGRDLRLDAMEQVKRIKRGESSVRDSDGNIVSKDAQAIIGGHATGEIKDQKDWRDKMVDYSHFALNFHPFSHGDADDWDTQ